MNTYLAKTTKYFAQACSKPVSKRTLVNWKAIFPQKVNPTLFNEEATKIGAELGVAPELFSDPKRLRVMLHLRDLFQTLGIKDEVAQKKFWEEVHISPGYPTLEWVHASPPPVHTYEEMPLVKTFPAHPEFKHDIAPE